MHRFTCKSMVYVTKSLLQARLLGRSENYFSLCSVQARCLTGSVIASHTKVQQNWLRVKGVRLGLLAIPCAFKSVSAVKALAKDIAAVKSASEYLYLYDRFKDSTGMTQVNRITILHHLAKLAVSGPTKNFISTRKALNDQKDIFITLLNNIGADLETCKARDLATIVWSLGKLREHDAWFVTECEKEILRRDQTSFRAPAVCKILIGFASLDLTRSEFFAFVEQRILEGQLKMAKFENRGLVTVLWSFTKTGNGSKELLEKFQEEILSRDVKEFSSDHLAQFLWSFTQKVHVPGNKLFKITEKEILQRPLRDLSDYCIKMLLWSFAKAGLDEEEDNELFLRLSAEIILRGVRDFDTEELSMLAWAFAKRCPKAVEIFDLVEEELYFRGISKFGNRELSLLLWSFAKSGHVRIELFIKCQNVLISRDLSLLKTDQLSQLVWAFGRLPLLKLDLLREAESEVLCNVSIFSDEELCMILHGFSQASVGTQELFKQLEREVLDRNIPENKPELVPQLASTFSKCSYEALSIFDAIEKVVIGTGLSMYTEQELQDMSMAFSKVGRKLPFVEQTVKDSGRVE